MSNVILASHVTVHQSRWGYHPCSYDVFVKLKELNKLYVDALHRKAAWERWNRKEPQNRFIRRKLRDSNGQVVGYGVSTPMNEPKLNNLLVKHNNKVTFVNGADIIASEYKYARTPQPSEKDVRPLKISEGTIDRLLQEK